MGRRGVCGREAVVIALRGRAAPDALGDVASESDSRDADPRKMGASGNTE